MKLRHVVIFSGHAFEVPQRIQRIDTRNTHGWQVRYQGTKFFSDGSPDGTGAGESLRRAVRELSVRMAENPLPVALSDQPYSSKRSGLPVGISGPIVRMRQGGQTRVAEFALLLPRFGQSPLRRTIYIGSERTYNEERYKAALDKAMALRREAEERYEIDARAAQKREAKALRQASVVPRKKA